MAVIQHHGGMQLEQKDVVQLKKEQGVANGRDIVPPFRANKDSVIAMIRTKAKKCGACVPGELESYEVNELQTYLGDERNFKKARAKKAPEKLEKLKDTKK